MIHYYTRLSIQLHNPNPFWYWLWFSAVWCWFNVIRDNSKSWSLAGTSKIRVSPGLLVTFLSIWFRKIKPGDYWEHRHPTFSPASWEIACSFQPVLHHHPFPTPKILLFLRKGTGQRSGANQVYPNPNSVHYGAFSWGFTVYVLHLINLMHSVSISLKVLAYYLFSLC